MCSRHITIKWTCMEIMGCLSFSPLSPPLPLPFFSSSLLPNMRHVFECFVTLRTYASKPSEAADSKTSQVPLHSSRWETDHIDIRTWEKRRMNGILEGLEYGEAVSPSKGYFFPFGGERESHSFVVSSLSLAHSHSLARSPPVVLLWVSC